ncbi:uncharacterized protein G2W53_041627 [Senna tora]|uniref:Uncharacterized protein n=1 Tax=Senna tora TaxID=362788 RepID=A0A834SFB5_9FABA|nr:uncharacterized protein G2W53_041627 [Senna tora]
MGIEESSIGRAIGERLKRDHALFLCCRSA